MNCHDNNDNRNHIKHILMMILCCGLPIFLLFVLSLIRFGNPAIKDTISGIIPYICPLMMIAMIPMMFMGNNNQKSKNCCSHKEDNNP